MGLNSGVSQDHLDEVQGHAESTVSSSYALDEDGMRYTQPVLLEAIRKMEFWNVTQGLEVLMSEVV